MYGQDAQAPGAYGIDADGKFITSWALIKMADALKDNENDWDFDTLAGKYVRFVCQVLESKLDDVDCVDRIMHHVFTAEHAYKIIKIIF
jgi:hypothetical protein